MRLYKNSEGVWAGTQADARKICGKTYSTVDVPTDKPNLLKFLNLNQVGSYTSNDKQDTITGEIDTSNRSLGYDGATIICAEDSMKKQKKC